MDHTEKLRVRAAQEGTGGDREPKFLMMPIRRDLPLSALARLPAPHVARIARPWEGESNLLAAFGL